MQVILFTDVADTIGYGKYAGTYKIATEVRRCGYTCQVIDLFSFYSLEQLSKIIKKFVTKDTLLVGFSCTLMEKRIGNRVLNFGRPDQEFIDIVKEIKSINQKTKICLGGARMTIHSYWEGVDYVIINKGDSAILALLDHIENQSNIKIHSQHRLKVIDGNDYFYTQEQFANSFIEYVSEDIIFDKEALPIEVARGCIFKCAFCHFDLIGKKIGDWQKSKNVLYDEICKNNSKFGTEYFMFTDELINESLPKVKLLHEVITSLPFNLRFTSYARLDLIWRFPEMRELLLESGAGSLAFGIETMNEVAGKKIGKALGKQKIIETLNYCNEAWKGKIITSSNFIVGLPGETKESILDTVDYLISDECPLDVFGFLPLYIRTDEDGRSASKIDKDPNKFGYVINENNQWVGEKMTFNEALGLIHTIYANPKVKERTKFSAATWIGRIINLGYTVEEIFTLINDKALPRYELNKELTKRTLAKKTEYYKRLMSL
jgi:hypothetical protein